MEVSILTLQELFVKPVRYEVPPFQRRYIWNQEQQWEPLWNDVQNTAERYLGEGEPVPNQKPSHFLGAVVLQQQPNRTAMLETRIVVDGQQRLTTLQLLLDAVQEVFEQRPDISDYPARRLSRLVLNDEVYHGDDPDRAFKVWPTMDDQNAFRHAMHNDLPSEQHRESSIVQAHEYFKQQVTTWLDENPEENETRAEALERALANLLQMVVIDLAIAEDPHIIFETLNARGTPLLESDLVKNMILYEVGKSNVLGDTHDPSRFWNFTGNWWSKEIRQGRLIRARIDVFLNYWIIMRRREEVMANKVFSEFRRYVDDSDQSIELIATDMARIGESYVELEEGQLPSMETFLYRRDVMQSGIMNPILLWLLSSEVPQEQVQKGLRALESYLVRRMVCRKTTMGLNRLFIALVGVLEEAGATSAGDTIVKYLGDQKSNVGLWPTDLEVESAFAKLPLYWLLTRGRLRLVLEGIEEELRTDKVEVKAVPRNLTIEHIMPQGWREHWPLPSQVDDTAKASSERNQMIHTIGNLTLVNRRLNPALSNSPWSDKRTTIEEHSVLFLNKNLLSDADEIWDEAAIESRSQRLFQEAVKVWPYADKI